jgi:hypothetical protein
MSLWLGNLEEKGVKNILIATIGNRDVKLIEDDKTIDLFPPREEGEKVFSQLKKKKNSPTEKIKIPLIEETFKYLTSYKYRVDKVYLVVTNQEGAFANKDTLWFGRIIEQVLCGKKFKTLREKIGLPKPGFSDNDVDVEFFELTEYINDFEANFEFFNEKFSQLDQSEIGNIIIEYTGGMPQINYSLVLSALFNFDSEKIIPIVVDEKDKGARKSAIVSKTLREINAIRLKHFIRRYDYKAALHFLKGFNPLLRQILTVASARLDFDFYRSNSLLVELREKDREKKTYEKLNHLLGHELSIEQRIEEIYFHLEIKLRNEEYHDFLSRFYCFYDNYVHLLLKEFGYNIVELETENEQKRAHNEFIEKNPELKDYLENHKKLSHRGNTSTKIRFNMAKFLHKGNDKFAELKEINDKKFEKMIEMRNRTIIAHRLKGMTERDLAGLYSPNDRASSTGDNNLVEEILRDIRLALKFVNIIPRENIFDHINSIIDNKYLKNQAGFLRLFD